jgi:prepilin-type N-terminal cleavage/methylation domain-containing protein
MRKNKAFTLIEIIIVVVILGILASLSLPRLASQINKARAAEAFNTLGGLMHKISECYALESENVLKCNTAAQIETNTGYALPTSTNFSYVFDATTCTALISCGAKATALKGNAGSIINFSINLSNGFVSKEFFGDFSSLDK